MLAHWIFAIIPHMLASSLKTGTIFKENGHPFLVEKYEHTKTGRGGATVKVKARNLLTDQVLEKRYQSNSKVEDADVFRKNAQYLYRDSGYVFMDPDTYEQFTIGTKIIGDKARFFQEGALIQLMYFEGNPVSVDLPNTVVFEISDTVPGYKGNTVSNVLKDAKIQNGTDIKVPTFIKVGDRVKIDTRSGEYISKA